MLLAMPSAINPRTFGSKYRNILRLSEDRPTTREAGETVERHGVRKRPKVDVSTELAGVGELQPSG